MNTDVCYLNREALYSSGTEDFRIPPEPDPGQEVQIRFRTCREDVDRVLFIQRGKEEPREMVKVAQDPYFDFYGCTIVAGTEKIRYHFEVVKGNGSCKYNRLGTEGPFTEDFDFCITPGFHTPEWAKGAIMYQIYVDRFCNGDPSNDVEDDEYIYIGRPVRQIKEWDKPVEPVDVGCFYGGDLKGVWDKLDYLQRLGVEVIYLNPIFVSPSNHKYDCQDYEYIDPHYGVIVKDEGKTLDRDTCVAGEQREANKGAAKYICRVTDRENLEASNAFFARFVEEVHRRGMRLILDGVFNHCGSFNKWLDREGIYEQAEGYEPGAYVSAASPYRTFFRFEKEGQEDWPYNKSYAGWWGHDTLPKLNYEGSSKLQQYILDIAKKWVSPPYDVDGWRLDVAADLGQSGEFNHTFWKAFREAVRSADPDALILAEHYGDASGWLQGDEWDSVMNYDAFMEPLTWFLTGMEKHSDRYNERLYGDGDGFFRSMHYHMSHMQMPSVLVAMNELSNHDHSRFLTRTNRQVGRLVTRGAEAASEGISYGVFREAVMVQMTWPGAPTIYYGDEAGLCGWTDPDNRRTYPWGKEDLELLEFYRYMCSIHKRVPALRRGCLKRLLADHQLIAYGRMSGRSKAAVAVNNRDSERDVELPVWQLGIQDDELLFRVMVTTEEGYNVGKVLVDHSQGFVRLKLAPVSSVLLVAYGETEGSEEEAKGSEESREGQESLKEGHGTQKVPGEGCRAPKISGKSCKVQKMPGEGCRTQKMPRRRATGLKRRRKRAVRPGRAQDGAGDRRREP